jgi:hypothetical protein
MLLGRLTTDDLATLDHTHSDVVLDSIAEALARKQRRMESPFMLVDQTGRSR